MDSRDAWFAVLSELLTAESLPPVSAETFAATFGQSSAEDARRFFHGRITTEELDARYQRTFPAHVSRVRRIEEDSREVIEALAGRALALAIVTNAPGTTSRVMLEATGLDGAIPLVLTPEDVARPKPAPDLPLLAMRRLAVSPDETVLVGDSENDFGAGRASGVTTLGFRTDGGDRRIESLRELLARDDLQPHPSA